MSGSLVSTNATAFLAWMGDPAIRIVILQQNAQAFRPGAAKRACSRPRFAFAIRASVPARKHADIYAGITQK
jgi:hypothetical protein